MIHEFGLVGKKVLVVDSFSRFYFGTLTLVSEYDRRNIIMEDTAILVSAVSSCGCGEIPLLATNESSISSCKDVVMHYGALYINNCHNIYELSDDVIEAYYKLISEKTNDN